MKRLGPIEEAMKEANDFADNALKESKSNVKEYIAQAKKFLNKPIALETYKLVLVVAVVIAIIAVA
jgi:F0F1-type ATP synthase membrane subunit b/b'|tara:strand:+ start:161 stop:358 length:198 start_codon:yes stop_codon:yes gene_type:complete